MCICLWFHSQLFPPLVVSLMALDKRTGFHGSLHTSDSLSIRSYFFLHRNWKDRFLTVLRPCPELILAARAVIEKLLAQLHPARWLKIKRGWIFKGVAEQWRRRQHALVKLVRTTHWLLHLKSATLKSILLPPRAGFFAKIDGRDHGLSFAAISRTCRIVALAPSSKPD